MNKRQQQKRETREKIRACAKRLFEAQGYDATTSRQIAHEAKVAIGTLFVHFPNKSAILADILYEDIETVTKHAFATLPTTQATLDQLMYISRSLYTYYLAKIELSRTLLQKSFLQSADVADYGAQINLFIEAIARLIQAGQAKNDVVATKDATIMATTFMSAYFFVLMTLMRSKTPNLDAAIVQLRGMTTVIVT